MKLKWKVAKWFPIMSLLLLTVSSCGLKIDIGQGSADSIYEEGFVTPPTDSEQSDIQEELDSSWTWSASPVNLSGFEIQTVTVHDNKLYFISNGTLYQSGLDGSNIEQMDVIEPEELEFTAFMCIDVNCNLWFADVGGHIASYSMDGVKLNELKLEDSPEFWVLRGGIFGFPDGKVGAVASSLNGDYIIFAFDISTTVPEIIPSLGASIRTGSKSRYAHLNESKLLTWNKEGIYSIEMTENYELADGKEVILKWDDVGIYGESLRVLGISSENSIILMNDGILYALQQISSSTLTVRTELTLAVVGYLPVELSTAVSVYNLSEEECMIKIVEYDDIQLLNTEIVAGKVPDFMVTDSVPFNEYVRQGLFEDLTPYFDLDPDLALLPSIKKALSINQKLYRITPAFMIMTMIGSSDYIDKEMGWTFEEMYELVEDDVSALPSDWNRDNAMQFLIIQNISDYVDWENAESYFDTEDFKRMLEMVKSFPEINHFQTNDVEQVNNGKQLTLQRTLISHLDFVRIDNQLNGKTVFKGFPGGNKTVGTVFTWPFTIAMTSRCSDKEGAWRFMQSVLKSEYQQGFSSVDIIYNEQARKAMTAEYAEQYSEAILGNVPAMTSEQRKRFDEFLLQVNTLVESDQTISSIIIEEVAAYFAGQKSIDEVAKIIQNRVDLYIREQQ